MKRHLIISLHIELNHWRASFCEPSVVNQSRPINYVGRDFRKISLSLRNYFTRERDEYDQIDLLTSAPKALDRATLWHVAECWGLIEGLLAFIASRATIRKFKLHTTTTKHVNLWLLYYWLENAYWHCATNYVLQLRKEK